MALEGNMNQMTSTPETKLELVTKSSEDQQREHMFDKVVTPSDVGKLNRLVIPKQHAEKHFPLDASSNEKGLLLSFEDASGKQWRFRYSYWNSSQSYVMTKGWSRFVKDKKLDAGDVVSFHRGPDKSLFIDCRRRPLVAPPHHHHQHPLFPFSGRWGPVLRGPPPPPYAHMPQAYHHHPYRHAYVPTQPGQVFYLRPPAETVVFDSVPVVQHHGNGNKVSSKRLRLFGVNMECSSSSAEDECIIDASSSSTTSSSSLEQALQLRLFNGTPIPGISSASLGYLNKGKAFNLD